MTSPAANAWHAFTRLLQAVQYVGYAIAALALAGIVGSYSYEVVMRYIFNAPTWWSAELVSYLLCILTFSMMPHVTATRGQVAVTIFLEILPPRIRLAAERAIWFAGFLTCSAMAYFAYRETARQIARNIQMMATQPIPKWWVSIWIVAGFALAALAFLRLALAPASEIEKAPAAPMPEV